jgi:hypothetical protein
LAIIFWLSKKSIPKELYEFRNRVKKIKEVLDVQKNIKVDKEFIHKDE